MSDTPDKPIDPDDDAPDTSDETGSSWQSDEDVPQPSDGDAPQTSDEDVPPRPTTAPSSAAPSPSQGPPPPPQGSPHGQTQGSPTPAQANPMPEHGSPYPSYGSPYGQAQGAPLGPNGSAPAAGIPYPPQPDGPQTSPRTSKFLSALSTPATWRTALIPPGLALLAGIVVSIVLSVILTSLGDFDTVARDSGISLDSFSYALPFIILALSLFGSAVFRFNAEADGIVEASGSIVLLGAPLLVTVLVLGVLWWLTKRSELRSPSPNRSSTWTRIAISSLAAALVLFFLQMIFAARFSAMEGGQLVELSFSAVTARSFFLPLLALIATSLAARVAGHFKGTEAIGAPFLRRLVPPLLVTWVHLVTVTLLLSVVAVFVLPLGFDVPWQVVPATFVNAGLIIAMLLHFGGVSASAQGDLGFYSNGFSESLTIFSEETPGQLWIGLIVVVAAVLIAAVVSTVTRRPYWTVSGDDKQQWSSVWQVPLAFCVVWGLISVLAVPFRASLEGSAETAMMFDGAGAARFGVGPLAWSFLIFAVWGALIEVISRTVGARLALTFPALTRLAAGRAVHPYWGQSLGMSEPRFALIHPDAVADAARAGSPAAASTVGAPPPPPVGPTAGAVHPSQAESPGTGSAPQAHAPAAGSAPQAYAPGTGSAPQPAGSAGGSSPSATEGVSAGGHASGYSPVAQQFASGPVPPPAAASGATAYAPPPPQPFDKRKATIIGVAAGSVVVLIAAALIIVNQVNARAFSPEAAVEKYFSELADGDAEGALKIADVDVAAEQRQLLTNDVLSASKALPQNVSVQDAEVSGDVATVSATYDVAGSKGTSTFTLHRAGKTALVFDEWKLQAPELALVTVDTPGLSTVKVNGVNVDTDGSALSLPAFPGMYTVGLAEETELVAAEAVETRAFFADSVEAEGEEPESLVAQPSDAFRSEVDKQVKTLIDSCAGKTVAQPDGCPFGSSLAESYEAKNIKWSISSYPTVTVASDSSAGDIYVDPASATGPNGGPAWSLTTESRGEALVTGTYELWDDETETLDDTVSFSIDGTAEIVDGKVVITITPDPFGF